MAACLIIGKERMYFEPGITIEDAMTSSGKHPDAFLFLSGGRPIPVTTVMEEGSAVETLRVASGG